MFFTFFLLCTAGEWVVSEASFRKLVDRSILKQITLLLLWIYHFFLAQEKPLQESQDLLKQQSESPKNSPATLQPNSAILSSVFAETSPSLGYQWCRWLQRGHKCKFRRTHATASGLPDYISIHRDTKRSQIQEPTRGGKKFKDVKLVAMGNYWVWIQK